MARTRCGALSSSSLKLNWPLASVLVRPDSSMPWPNLRRMTSSPAAGLAVVEFLMVPVRVWAEARVVRRSAAHAVRTNAGAECGENALRGRLLMLRDKGSFDCVNASLRDAFTPLRMTGSLGAAGPLRMTVRFGAI